MRQRLLGWNTGLRVSELALGCGLLGAAGDGPDPETAHGALLAFAEGGGTLIDTSSAHQGGRSEELVGRFVNEHGRDRFVISTKYGRPPGGEARSYAGGAHPRAMLAQVEASLRRLRTDRIDLYAAEYPDGVTPVEEVMRGADLLVRQGKVVAFALSNFAAWQVAHAATLAGLRGWAPLGALHYQYNLLERSIESEHLSACEAFGVGVLAWSPQARGRLAREPLDGVPQATMAALRAIAADRGAATGTVALAWLLARGVIPVVGARSAAQLASSLAATDLRLTAEETASLDGPHADASRYPGPLMALMRAGAGIDDALVRSATSTAR